MKILVVDDHVLIRKGITLLLEDLSYVSEIIETDNGCDAVTLAIKHQPKIVLMDLSLNDGIDGFTAARDILASTNHTEIIVLTMHEEEVYVKKAIEHNISGYLLKNSETNDIEKAIRTVLRGEPYYKTNIPENQLKCLMHQQRTSVLTSREQEVIRLASLGYTNKQISTQLNISPKTVERHKENMMNKLNLKESHELIQFALRNDYVGLM